MYPSLHSYTATHDVVKGTQWGRQKCGHQGDWLTTLAEGPGTESPGWGSTQSPVDAVPCGGWNKRTC